MPKGTRPLLGEEALDLGEIDVPLERVASPRPSPSGTTRSSASTPSYSRFARVVSKCVFDGTTSPGFVATEKRIRSPVPGASG